jgi:hypothetical protein
MNKKVRVAIIALAVITIVGNGIVSVLGVIDVSEPMGVLKSIGMTGLGVFLLGLAFSDRKPSRKKERTIRETL